MKRLLVVTAIGLASCASEEVTSTSDPIPVDLSDFDPLVPLSELSLDAMIDVDTRYLQLRKLRAFSEDEPFLVVSSSSTVPCQGASDPSACESALALLRPSSGFYWVDHPSDAFHYLAAIDSSETPYSIGNESEMRELLQDIDSREEALYLLASMGYQWSSTTLEEGAIRETEAGYEVVVTETTSLCPIEAEAFLLEVAADSDVRELHRWTAYTSDLCS